jgi:radical SAM protein with 4Fe4S-binding SPASM domain
LKKRYIDPHVALKDADVKGSLDSKDGFPIFGLIEFNLWGACNRRCSFCPISDSSIFTNRKEGFSLENYRKILLDLKQINYRGVILWSMFSEPTLHKEHLDFASLTKNILPKACLQLTSNGDTLKDRPERLSSLFKAGVDRLNLSLYDGPDQFLEFTNLRKSAGLSTEQVKLRRRYLAEGNYGITISNRTGLIDANSYRDETEKPILSLPLDQPCYYPFYQIAVDYNGDVLLCPHDWGKKYVTGNAFDNSIFDIWRGAAFQHARKVLRQHSRNIASCRKCDVAGNLIGEENFIAFDSIFD